MSFPNTPVIPTKVGIQYLAIIHIPDPAYPRKSEDPEYFDAITTIHFSQFLSSQAKIHLPHPLDFKTQAIDKNNNF